MPKKTASRTKKIQIKADDVRSVIDSLKNVASGKYASRPDAAFEDPLMKEMIDRIREVIIMLDRQTDEFNRMTINLNLGVSECIKALGEVRQGRLNARVSQTVLSSENELISSLAKSLNDALEEIQGQLETIRRQQVVIQELSTPILQIWDGVLVLPVIGVLDTRRSIEIMERLLAEIAFKQTRFVILDVTGVEVVDTMTGNHFIKLIKAAELLGTSCILTGIRPAVAQTLADIGVDLSYVRTLRNLQAGLRECLHRMGDRADCVKQDGPSGISACDPKVS